VKQEQPMKAQVTRAACPAPRIDPKTPSGIEVPRVVTANMVASRDLGEPGAYPFARGIFADGYRGRPWTIRFSESFHIRHRSPMLFELANQCQR